MGEDVKFTKNTWQPKSSVVEVLGTAYTVKAMNETADKGLSGCAGYTDPFSKEIVVDNYAEFNDLYPASTLTKDVHGRIRHTVRHELIHAFMIESGVAVSSTSTTWAHDESVIEWLSTMLPKMIVAMEQVGAIEMEAPCPKN